MDRPWRLIREKQREARRRANARLARTVKTAIQPTPEQNRQAAAFNATRRAAEVSRRQMQRHRSERDL